MLKKYNFKIFFKIYLLANYMGNIIDVEQLGMENNKD